MFKLDYTLSRAHLASFQKIVPQRMRAANRTLWRGALALWLILILMSALTILAVTQVKGHAPDDISVFPGFIIGMGAMLATWSYRVATMRKYWLRDGGPTLAVHKTTADEAGLHCATPNFDSICRWPAVLEVTEHKDIVVVWIEAFHGFVIPRAAFADDASVRAFLDFARERIGKVG